MLRHRSPSESRARRRTRLSACETLESRQMLSATAWAVHVENARRVHDGAASVHAEKKPAPVLGRLSGQVTQEISGKPLRKVKVQLIDETGHLAETATTNTKGRYVFKIHESGAYVVRAIAPRRFVQTTPTFDFSEPEGTYRTGFGPTSWNYTSTNIDPSKGVVGPAGWASITTLGEDPFQSPINITGPTIDLDQVLSVHYNDAVPSKLINNGKQIQVQFPATGDTTVEIAGETFDLAQFHYHDPSENTVNGHTYPFEEHFVNASPSGARRCSPSSSRSAPTTTRSTRS
jgi:carbonic anhydrase